MNIAIILASGMGKRMGAGKNKTLLRLGKKPLVFYAIEKFQKSKAIDKIILVAKAGEEKIFQKIIERYRFKKVAAIISGGKERQDSAYNGVVFVKEKLGNLKDAILIFHNGANPFVAHDEIREVIANAKKFGASAVAHRTKDTIRKVDKNNFSQGVIDRASLWNMQTPQAIQFSLAEKAFFQAKKDNFLGTDDVSLVERLGKKVKIIEASDNNFKVTTPVDFELAKIILGKIRKKYV
jgi:2-C-methyl-D-erythritol 4-phosphate cytidylyltransferase